MVTGTDVLAIADAALLPSSNSTGVRHIPMNGSRRMATSLSRLAARCSRALLIDTLVFGGFGLGRGDRHVAGARVSRRQHGGSRRAEHPRAAGPADYPGRRVVPGGRVHGGPPRVEPVSRVVPRMRLAGSRADLATA